MEEIKTEIEIAAPPSKVWSIITDVENWKQWNPIVNQVRGEASPGSRLSVTMCGEGGKDANHYTPVVTDLELHKSFRWRAKMMAGFLFTNDKIFELEEISFGTRLIHIEAFSGLLTPIFCSKLNEHVPSMLNSMNEALKTLAEKSSNE